MDAKGRKAARGRAVSITYYSPTSSHEVSNDRLALIAKGMDHIFRRSLIAYVSALHDLLGGDYSPHVNSFLEIYGIQRDVAFETLRKICRDRIDRLNRIRKKVTRKSPAMRRFVLQMRIMSGTSVKSPGEKFLKSVNAARIEAFHFEIPEITVLSHRHLKP